MLLSVAVLGDVSVVVSVSIAVLGDVSHTFF